MATKRSSGTAPATTDILQDVWTLTDALRLRAQHSPNKAAYIFRHPNQSQRHVLTFADLYRLGGRWARVLHDKGIGRGHYVVNALPNSPERAVVESAILLSGAASTHGDYGLSDIINKSRATAVILDPDFLYDTDFPLDVSAYLEESAVNSEVLPSLRHVLLVRRLREEATDFLADLRSAVTTEVYHEQALEKGDTCCVFPTSGTTGPSKLVTFTHGTLLVAGKAFKLPTTSVSVEFNNGHMGWSGCYFGYVILKGTTRVCCDARAGKPRDLASFIFSSVKEEGVTTGTTPFYILPALAEKIDTLNEGQPLFDSFGLGRQAVTQQVVRAASKIARNLIISYSASEMLPLTVAFNIKPDSYEDYFAGTLHPGVKIKIRDHQGQDVGINTHGEILVKTPFIFHGYLNDAEATAAAYTDDGFFRSGDVGWLSDEGKLYVEGRTMDAITLDGNIFYPGRLETRLRSCPTIKDVVLVGVPNANLHNELCACVVPHSQDVSLDDVKKFVESEIREKEDERVFPRPLHYLLFEAFPMTPSGKIKRHEVRALAAQRLTK